MRYLGNKTRMIENISSFIDELNIEGKVFCDLFAGSASVADYFKDKYQIIFKQYSNPQAIEYMDIRRVGYSATLQCIINKIA